MKPLPALYGRTARFALISFGALLSLNIPGCVSREPAAVSVELMPGSVQSLDPGQPLLISATVSNDASEQGVVWNLEGTGALMAETASSVMYQAPTDTKAPVFVRVVAYSKAESSKKAVLTLWLVPQLKVSTGLDALPNGRPGLSYVETLVANGGVGPFEWSLKEGSLPPGLSLTSAGVISGTPESDGGYEFTVQVKDAENFTALAELKIVVSGTPAPGRKRV